MHHILKSFDLFVKHETLMFLWNIFSSILRSLELILFFLAFIVVCLYIFLALFFLVLVHLSLEWNSPHVIYKFRSSTYIP
jgi:hypothetical protein